MNRITLSLFLVFNTFFSKAQVSLNDIALEYGKYQVGFKHYLLHDSTRTYQRIFDWNNKSTSRPIPISV